MSDINKTIGTLRQKQIYGSWNKLPKKNEKITAEQRRYFFLEIEVHQPKDQQLEQNICDWPMIISLVLLIIIPELIIRYTLAILITIVTLPVVLTMALASSCADVDISAVDDEKEPEPREKDFSNEEEDDDKSLDLRQR